MNGAPCCRANRHPMPSKDLAPAAWVVETLRHMAHYEPCGKPATHLSYNRSKPLCEEHARELRAALASPDALGNVLAGRPRTQEEIARMVVPIESVQ
jgi:hypothetical protein